MMDLESYFAQVEDISEPTLLDDLQIALEQIQAEDDEFMQILLEKRNEMIVTWTQPWYQKSNCLTRPLKPIGDETLENFRTDTICFEERKLIDENWENFRKIFGVPNKPRCLARWRNTAKSRNPKTPEEAVRRFVMSFLAQGLKRTIYQVYKFFVTHYGAPLKGKYSEYEENIMAICVYHNPKNAVPYLSAILGREPRGIYKRLFQIFNGKPEKKKLKWTLPLATKFVNLLIEYTGEPLENLKYKKFDKSVWLKLEAAMEQQYVYLQLFWYHTLHVQLFVKRDMKLNRLRKKILKTIKNYSYHIWSDIRWKEILTHFPDGFSHGFLYRITLSIFKKYKGYGQTPLSRLLEYGLQKVKTMPNRRLKTLILNEKQELEIIKYKQ